MHLNRAPDPPPRKPCLRDLHRLTATLLPAPLVQLASLKQLRRRCAEIDATHPQYREETPLVLRYETQRRRQLGGGLQLTPEADTEPLNPFPDDASPAPDFSRRLPHGC